MVGHDSERIAALSGVAATSLGVAALRAFETARDDRLFEDPYARCFVSAAVAGALTRKFSMLDVAYKQSRLLHGKSKALGHRVPDVLDVDGERIYPRMASGAILYAGDPTVPRELASELSLPAVNGDLAALTRFFGRDYYVALIRPDHIVGAVANPKTSDCVQFAAALGWRRFSD